MVNNLREIERKVRTRIDVLSSAVVSESYQIDDVYILPCDYKSGSELPSPKKYARFASGETWGAEHDQHAWFRFSVSVPKSMRGKTLDLRIETGADRGWNPENPQFIIYIDGVIRQGLDCNHHTVRLGDANSYDVVLYAYNGSRATNVTLRAYLDAICDDVRDLYYDMSVPFRALDYLDTNSYEYQTVLSALSRAVDKIDFLKVPSPAFYASIADAKKEMDAFYRKTCHKSDYSVIGIGHTHIDIAWLWTVAQTREKAQRSFATVVELMKRYPEYKFMSSQAILYKQVKEEAPALYEEIKKFVAEGRWEVEGAMWVEADCNLSSGESLVRQVQYGKNFFRDEFGVESHVLWLPDVFGYAAALPQILRKSGVDWFFTSKIGWNDTNTMPCDAFYWQGIDGTRIPSYFLTTQDKFRGREPGRISTYCPGNAGPSIVAGTWDRFQQKHLHNEAILTFGYGDGGGGPTEEMLEELRREKYGIPGCPVAKIDKASTFLSSLGKSMAHANEKEVPVWQGELYLEFHRGTYTSHAKNKRENRRAEFAMLDAEALSVLQKRLFGTPYPKSHLHGIWETILTNQFHDIIPGSSIPEVYEVTDHEYAEIAGELNEIRADAFEAVASRVSDGGYVVFNPHSFANSAHVMIGGKCFYVENVPAKGYRKFKTAPQVNSILVSAYTVETPFYKVTFNKNYEIASLYDKTNKREVLKKGSVGNRLIVLEDYPDEYDAWEFQKASNAKLTPIETYTSVKAVKNGARTGIAIVRPFMESKIQQTVWFYENSPRIDFETKLDWHEKHQSLKTSFPVDVNADRATYEIQFGTIERPTHANTSWDAAKFEVCAHKYADLSEGNYGVSLLNDCKYGHDIHDGEIRLSLLRCAKAPGEHEFYNDQGEHVFTYALYPHAGTLRDADTVKLAYDLNLPMTAVPAHGDGSLPDEFSFVSCDCDNVVIETIKEEEYGSAEIVRMYETKNARSTVTLTFGVPVEKVALCDLSEHELRSIPVRKNTVTFEIKPFEIVTLKVK